MHCFSLFPHSFFLCFSVCSWPGKSPSEHNIERIVHAFFNYNLLKSDNSKFVVNYVYTVLYYFLQDWAANYWVQLGVPRHKLVIGMATYGRGFTLADRDQYDIGAAIRGKSAAGTYTREPGFLAYYEVNSCIYLQVLL